MLKKSIFLLSSAFFMSLLFSFRIEEKKQPAVRTIIIDAGHGISPSGGYDGAKGTYSHEDDICFGISKKLIAQIAVQYPNVRIIETRPTKYKVDLRERADIANQNKGDLFISIHVNAMSPKQGRELTGYKTETYYTGKGKKRKKQTRKVAQYRYYSIASKAKGTQTYIWGAHKSDDKETAIRENAPMFSEENYKEKYGDMDVNSPEFIALSLVKTKQFFKRSSKLADFLTDEFSKAGRFSQGSYQRQKGIWVLQATAMPSVLIETGFITNQEEEDYLNSESGQTQMAGAISGAIGSYIKWVEQQAGPTSSNNNSLPNNSTGKMSASFLQAIDNREKAQAKK
ncbi:MAG: N-acetylmuramoyl-L-alanine amidase [Flaviaesturariibacter sp.]|nr:N-acetylmuramoyl-L-alanine amidase [Flaviaesturariibacter sp.]